MPNIIGTAPNQVPTNADLGTMAYQDSNAVKVQDITFSDGSSQQTAASGFGFKNRIINGAMMIDQRNAGASVTFNAGTGGAYTVDRFSSYRNTSGSFTVQQSSIAPNGFKNSCLITVTSADSSVASTDVVDISQVVEGFNIFDFGWGTPSAVDVTASFWVRSSVIGTFSCAIRGSDTSAAYVREYSINAANTWQYVTVVFPKATTGTWATGNTAGLNISWTLMAGSSFQTLPNAWTTGNVFATSNQTNLMATNGATFYITGVQLEKGSTATSFDYRPYGTELALCQRYCVSWVSGNQSSGFTGSLYTNNAGAVWYKFPVTMRAAPTISETSTDFEIIGLGPTTGTIANISYSTIGIKFDGVMLGATATTGMPLCYKGTGIISAEL